jgi:hypothetical protein
VERILASAVALREVILGLSLLLGVLLRQAVGAVLDLPLLPALRALVRLVGESLVVVAVGSRRARLLGVELLPLAADLCGGDVVHRAQPRDCSGEVPPQ